MAEKELMIPVQGRDLGVLFADPTGIDKLLADIEKQALSVVADVAEAKGRKAIASMAFAVARTKTTLDDAGKNLVAAEKARLALIDAERKRVRDRLDTLKADVRRPLDEWEEAEKARVAGIQARLAQLRATPAGTAQEATTMIVWAETVDIDDSWQEFIAEAAQLKDAFIRNWRAYVIVTDAAEKAEAAAEAERIAEAERLQRERDERIAREATERAEREAKARAEEEQRRAEARIKAAEDAAHQAKVDAAAEAAASIRRAAEAEAERQRRKEQQEREAEAERARIAADADHRRRIHGEIVAALQDAGIARALAVAMVKHIAGGSVPHVTIQY
jgi:hypothetical protein